MRQLEQLLEPSKFNGLSDSRQSIDAAMQRIFSSPPETRLLQVRRIMGTTVMEVSDEDLEVYITEIQYLIEAWFDEFERQAFDGVTLKQLIQE